jgi:glycerate 2-kinase
MADTVKILALPVAIGHMRRLSTGFTVICRPVSNAMPKTSSPTPHDKARAHLVSLLQTAIETAQPARCLPPHLPPLPSKGRLIVLGAGKAAAAMAQAAETHYERLGTLSQIKGLVTTRHGYALPARTIEVLQSAHPVPDAASVDAADRSLALAATATASDLVLVLLSGGASALWSAPVDGVSLAAKQALTRQLLRSGAPIEEMNVVRKHLSRIKGGRLALAAKSVAMLTLAISDVIGDDPATIGSGPTVGDPTTLTDAREILRRRRINPSPEIAAALEDVRNESPKPGDACFRQGNYRIIAAARQSLEAARKAAEAFGYKVHMLGEAIEGEARDVAAEHAAIALAARQRGERVLLMSGGELTVTLMGNGTGGRNQEYALALAMHLNGAAGISAIAAGTDGADGGTGAADDPAGALIDASTLARAWQLNLNSAMFLENNDSGGFFSRLGDLVVTGPSQTNVNDFRAILVES